MQIPWLDKLVQYVWLASQNDRASECICVHKYNLFILLMPSSSPSDPQLVYKKRFYTWKRGRAEMGQNRSYRCKHSEGTM